MSHSNTSYRFGPYRLDGEQPVLWCGSRIVVLAPKAVELLRVLVEAAGDVVRKNELLARVWPDTFVEEANLSVNVSQIRKALGTQEGGEPYIATIPRRGYRFVARVTATQPTRSLAVLPFRWLGQQDDDDCLGLGMADALITRLGRLDSLVLRPTGAVLRFARTELEPTEIGRRLHVDGVLDGSLQRSAERLRLTVQLVPVSDAVPSWAERFEETVTDVFSVQDTVAERIAGALALTLGAPERASLRRRETEDVAAFQSYVRGRWLWSRFSPTWIVKALQAFEEAIRRDPSYARPHVGLADIHLVSGFSGLIKPAQAWAAAEASANKALELDGSLADAHVCLGYVRLFRDWDWPAAEDHLAQAVEQDPSSAGAQQWLGLYQIMRGRLDAAATAVARAAEMDPLSVATSAMGGLLHRLAGDHQLELECQRRTVDLDPGQFLGYWALGLALQSRGSLDEALQAHRRSVELSEDSPLLKAVLGRTLALAGRRDQALETLSALEGSCSPYQRATIYQALGDDERALAELERACEQHDPWVVWLRVDPMLDSMRSDPRFQRLVARVFATA